MVLRDNSSETEKGELLLDGAHLSFVSYRIRSTGKDKIQFIGELLLHEVDGEIERVYEAAKRKAKFTLRLQDERLIMVFLMPETPNVGFYEILAFAC